MVKCNGWWKYGVYSGIDFQSRLVLQSLKVEILYFEHCNDTNWSVKFQIFLLEICAVTFCNGVKKNWKTKWIWASPSSLAARRTQTGNGQALWGNSIHLSSTVKKIESLRHLRWFNGVNILTVLHNDLSKTGFMDYWVQCKISHFS